MWNISYSFLSNIQILGGFWKSCVKGSMAVLPTLGSIAYQHGSVSPVFE